MPAIDVDPEILRIIAAASEHAYGEAITHVEAEIKAADGNLEPLINTLNETGPYAYTLIPDFQPDGTVKLPILTTREEIAEAYAFIRGASDLLQVIGLTEVRGSWYLFQDGISRGQLKGSDEVGTHRTLAIFPSGAGSGITGELVWTVVPRSMLGRAGDVDEIPDDPLVARERVFEQYARYLDALRANDRDALLSVLHDGLASAVRDYVDDTGSITQLKDIDDHRAYYEAFFEKYEVQAVQPLYQVTDDGYVFAELRMTVLPRRGGTALTYHTAEFFIPAKNGRFMVRIGHGTEPA